MEQINPLESSRWTERERKDKLKDNVEIFSGLHESFILDNVGVLYWTIGWMELSEDVNMSSSHSGFWGDQSPTNHRDEHWTLRNDATTIDATDHDLTKFGFRYIAELNLFNSDCFARSPVQGTCQRKKTWWLWTRGSILVNERTVDLTKSAFTERITKLL